MKSPFDGLVTRLDIGEERIRKDRQKEITHSAAPEKKRVKNSNMPIKKIRVSINYGKFSNNLTY